MNVDRDTVQYVAGVVAGVAFIVAGLVNGDGALVAIGAGAIGLPGLAAATSPAPVETSDATT